VKRYENRLKSVSKKITKIIKKFDSWISSNSTFRRWVKNTLIFVCTFFFICLAYLLIQTKSPPSDVFTTGRISILKNRPANITKDIIIDLFSLSERGGVTVLTKALIEDIAKKRQNWRLLILTAKNRRHTYDYLPQSDNVKRIEIDITPSPLIYLQFKSSLFGKLQDKLTQLLHYDSIFSDSRCDLIWDPIGDCSLCNFVTIPRISTIHDLACFNNNSKSPIPKDKLLRAYLTTNTIHFSKKIITVSEFSQKQICDKFYVSKDFVNPNYGLERMEQRTEIEGLVDFN